MCYVDCRRRVSLACGNAKGSAKQGNGNGKQEEGTAQKKRERKGQRKLEMAEDKQEKGFSEHNTSWQQR